MWAKPYIQAKEGYTDLTTEEMVIKLQAAFSNPDPCTRAEAKLMKLHQGSWTYTKYLTKTLTLHADLTLDEEAKIMHFQ